MFFIILSTFFFWLLWNLRFLFIWFIFFRCSNVYSCGFLRIHNSFQFPSQFHSLHALHRWAKLTSGAAAADLCYLYSFYFFRIKLTILLNRYVIHISKRPIPPYIKGITIYSTLNRSRENSKSGKKSQKWVKQWPYIIPEF